MTPEELSTFKASAEALQKKYSRRRALWARHIGRPYADEDLTPEPGALPLADEENG